MKFYVGTKVLTPVGLCIVLHLNLSSFCFFFILYRVCVQIEVIRALAVLKKATAIVNKEFGLEAKLADVIVEASDEVNC